MTPVCIRVCVAVFIFAFGLYMRGTRTPTLCSTDVAVAAAAVGVRARPKCGPMIYADLRMYRQVCARVFVCVRRLMLRSPTMPGSPSQHAHSFLSHANYCILPLQFVLYF